MSQKGQLCYSIGSSHPLCFKHNGSDLIYKGEKLENCIISVIYGKQSWTCNTYRVYHDITYQTSGSGMNEVYSESRTDCSIFEVVPFSNATFTLSVTASTDCQALAQEHPGATCTVSAQQGGVTSKVLSNIELSPNISKSIYVKFDNKGKLNNIN